MFAEINVFSVSNKMLQVMGQTGRCQVRKTVPESWASSSKRAIADSDRRTLRESQIDRRKRKWQCSKRGTVSGDVVSLQAAGNPLGLSQAECRPSVIHLVTTCTSLKCSDGGPLLSSMDISSYSVRWYPVHSEALCGRHRSLSSLSHSTLDIGRQ